MTREQFWNIIEAVNEQAGSEPDEKLEALGRAVHQLNPDDVVDFQTHFETFMAEAYRWDLWAAAYIIQGGCSDDGFTDFRACVIMQGQEVFAAAITKPDSLVDVDLEDAENELGFEGYQYVAGQIYEEKTGKELPLNDVECPNDPVGENWNEDDTEDLKRICPNLFKMYY